MSIFRPQVFLIVLVLGGLAAYGFHIGTKETMTAAGVAIGALATLSRELLSQ